MLELTEWVADQRRRLTTKPWLMLGKGPSFARRDEFDLGAFHLISLNHSVREVRVDVAHIIDIDVVQDCDSVLADQCDFLVMPRYPHVQARPGLAALEDYLRGSAALRRLDAEGRLVWYNLATAPTIIKGSPTLTARYFGSEGALGVLGELGAKDVRTLGVDGGVGYAAAFTGDAQMTYLANGQASFDMQFIGIREVARRYDIDVRSLVEPLRVFVGTSHDEMVPYRVLAHSIHANSSVPVVVEPLTSVRSPAPRDRANRQRTNFSFARFHIPDLCDFRGRAVYLDSDMLVFADVAELADYPLGEAWLACTEQEAPPAWTDSNWFHPGRQFSVMVLDCEQLDWHIGDIVDRLDRGELTYSQLLFEMGLVPSDRIDGTLPRAWNSLEHVDDETKLVHYTVVPSQPWKNPHNPIGHVWDEAFRRAVADGAVPRSEVRHLVERGGRPELLTMYDELAPTAPRPARNTSEVALGAALAEVDRLRARPWRKNSAAIASAARAAVGKLEGQGPAMNRLGGALRLVARRFAR